MILAIESHIAKMMNELVFYNSKSFSIYWAKTKLLPFRKSAFIAT